MNKQPQYQTQRSMIEGEFTTSDQTSLYYRYWPAEITPQAKAIILFHRGHEHSGRVAHLVDELDLPDFSMFAWDARGHGKNTGARGYSPSIGTSIKDINEFVNYISIHYNIPLENIIVVGQGISAVLVCAWVHDYVPKIRGMILASPAFKMKLYVPFAQKGLSLMQKMRGLFYVNSYIKAHYLTHDKSRIDSFNQDPLITHSIAVNILLDLYKTTDRILKDINTIKLPTQLLISGNDHVVHTQPQHLFYQHLNTPIKEKHIFAHFYHDTLGEKERSIAIDKMRLFIENLFSQPIYQHNYQHEDKWSHSADVYRDIQTPLENLSVKKLQYKILNYTLRTIAKTSEGLTLGFDRGFDSGEMLDYVYRNEPQGKGLLGRIIDKKYLNNVGWQGIRQRKINLENTIRYAIRHLTQHNLPVHIVDIAAGQGRYLFDAVNDFGKVDSILLRDYSLANVELGRIAIQSRYLTEKMRFEEGNAFDAESLSAISPAPTLAIASGIYELFPDNELLRISLKGLAQAIPRDGLLIYTCQPWHPGLEKSARLLPCHQDGKPWIMRCRSQGELDSLVNQAGFEKVDQIIDNWGIFSVSVAKRC